MATKLDAFVTDAAAELTSIRRRIEEIAVDAQVLANRWQVLGKTNMAGWAEYNWAGMPCAAAELAQAINGLSVTIDTADGVNLTNMHTQAKAADKIVKAGL